jgi:hypothetical protein
MITKDQWNQAAEVGRDQGDPTKLETLVSRSLLEQEQGPPGISPPPARPGARESAKVGSSYREKDIGKRRASEVG